MDTLNFCILLVPIIVIYLLLAYTKSAIIFSNTVLGKLFAVMLIAFYANTDVVLGLFICVLIILYYQSDFVEGMLNLSSGYTGSYKYVDQPPIVESASDHLESIDPEIMINNIPNIENLTKYCMNNSTNKNCQIFKEKIQLPKRQNKHMAHTIDRDEIDKYYDKNTVLKTIEIDSIRSNSITEKKLIIETELLLPKDYNSRN